MEPQERRTLHPPVTERLVARLWDEQHLLRRPLVTTGGDEVEVVYRGRRRWDRGPDFPDALLLIGQGGLSHGDVEIHVRSSDWESHGHHRDPHYNRVALHVVLWPTGSRPTVRQDGVHVPVLALSSHLAVPLTSLLVADEAEAPRPSPCWPGSPDRDGPLAGLLESSGMERFEARMARLESDLSCAAPDQLLYQRIADALGFMQNREPFRRLAELLPLETLLAYRAFVRSGMAAERYPTAEARAPAQESGAVAAPSPLTALEALLLGAAGLLDPHRANPSDGADRYVETLRRLWAADGPTWAGGAMGAGEWQFFRVRPHNFPTRRVAALAALVDRWPEEGLADWLETTARSSKPRALARALEGQLMRLAPGGYWAGHWDLALLLPRSRDLIGRQRAADVAINAFLPYLAARAARLEDDVLARKVRDGVPGISQARGQRAYSPHGFPDNHDTAPRRGSLRLPPAGSAPSVLELLREEEMRGVPSSGNR